MCIRDLKMSCENTSKILHGKKSGLTSSRENELLQNLQLSSQDVLEAAQKKGRSTCPKCHSSRMFYCYTCYVPVENVPKVDIPCVKLPLEIDIIKHPNETDGKSTAIHAKLLAYDDVTVHTFPCIPDYYDQRNEVILVFPGKNSMSLKDSLSYLNNINPDGQKKESPNEPTSKRPKLDAENDRSQGEEKHNEVKRNSLKKVIFIDSTWNQTNKIILDERLQGLVTVELTERKTCFWRHQKGSPDTYLSTIEAIYYFMVDYHTQILERDYHGDYDNLLFFYSFMYRLIKDAKKSAGKQ
ncbi:tRNA-uridine aminocarboxypropyltransferase 1 [Spea bombifrons]|uniref:tRNA-uridine aminocarboxypropyltransferase 1 n=1 Tax=Spea bombifrons TaxID=233779 RepID=UPI00234BD6DB|nr:tRNA-uridine aminocarboxypropyltransferase 1 [Spea bombifrons]